MVPIPAYAAHLANPMTVRNRLGRLPPGVRRLFRTRSGDLCAQEDLSNMAVCATEKVFIYAEKDVATVYNHAGQVVSVGGAHPQGVVVAQRAILQRIQYYDSQELRDYVTEQEGRLESYAGHLGEVYYLLPTRSPQY